MRIELWPDLRPIHKVLGFSLLLGVFAVISKGIDGWFCAWVGCGESESEWTDKQKARRQSARRGPSSLTSYERVYLTKL